MSRIGRLPITVPTGVTVNIKEGEVTVKGPKGQLNRSFNPDMAITQKDNVLVVSRPSDSRSHRALHGLTRSLLANMVAGVSKGYEKSLEVVGVGYRVEKQGDKVVLRVGYTHLPEVVPMPGVTLDVEGANRIKVSGVDKEVVGQMAARIRGLRPLDDYKGKGIKYVGETVRLKPGKAGKAVGGK
ncbi:MAG: 50S ribosomal protein L6 [Chloroflexi bacterium]|nr:50S ribosomal protein L6 [Chloroflexota bacterium]